MWKTRLSIAGLVLLIVFGLGVALSLLALRRLGAPPAPMVVTTATVLKQVQGLSQLVTVKYVFEKVSWLEDPPPGWSAMYFATENRVLLLAHGIVKAGVDLQKISPGDIHLEGRTIIVTLPPPVITDTYLDDKKTQVIERKTGFLRKFDKDLEQKARVLAVEDIRRAARDSGILADAHERARLQLENLFRQMGFDQVEFRAPK